MKVKVLNKVEIDKQHHLWHKGKVADIITDNGVVFSIVASDVVKASIVSSNGLTKSIGVKDSLEKILSKYANVEDDLGLLNMLSLKQCSKDNTFLKLNLEESNYFYLVYTLNGVEYNLNHILEAAFLDEAIVCAKEDIELYFSELCLNLKVVG